MKEPFLMIPGPTNLSERVRRVMSQPQMAHVSPTFYERFQELLKLSRYVFKNEKGFQYAFTGTGTLGMEASVVNVTTHGDRALVLNTGYFGRRFVMLNEIHGVKVDSLDYPDGVHADPDDLRRKLAREKYKAVFITHVDTGSTIINPIRDLVRACQDSGVFSIVDSVCGIGGVELNFDDLAADVVFTASQKALAAPPGAVMIAVSNDLLRFVEGRKDTIESYYLNLSRWKPIMDDPKIYLATPSIQVLLALAEALEEVREEGIEKRWARHQKVAETFRRGISGLPVDFVAEEGYRADTVSGFWVQEGRAPEIQRQMREKHGIEISRGLLENGSRMLRFGHLGNLTKQQAAKVTDAFGRCLRDLNVVRPVKPLMAAAKPS